MSVRSGPVIVNITSSTSVGSFVDCTSTENTTASSVPARIVLGSSFASFESSNAAVSSPAPVTRILLPEVTVRGVASTSSLSSSSMSISTTLKFLKPMFSTVSPSITSIVTMKV